MSAEAAGLELVANVAGAENAGGEADEGIEDDEDDVEVIDQDVGARRRLVDKSDSALRKVRKAASMLMRAEIR
jgi:hypothetical protein